MKINWTVRFKNPVFWAELVAAVLLPILTHLGMNWEDITTWAKLGEIIVTAFQNPVIMVAVAVSVWNALNDPTTKGLSDSKNALTYTEPK
jgi:phi LC3 family holin